MSEPPPRQEGAQDDCITVYHGRKIWSKTEVIRASAIEYMIGRGRNAADARNNAEILITQLNDTSNSTLLEISLRNAQEIGPKNPFVSTSLDRDVARRWALEGGTPGYILTIAGPRSAFYDFNGMRTKTGLPQYGPFWWMKEMGIPLELREPFKVRTVEYIRGVIEETEIVFQQEANS